MSLRAGHVLGSMQQSTHLRSAIAGLAAELVESLDMRGDVPLVTGGQDGSAHSWVLTKLVLTLVATVGGLLVLLVVTMLSVYKPRGLTRCGWRRPGRSTYPGTTAASHTPDPTPSSTDATAAACSVMTGAVRTARATATLPGPPSAPPPAGDSLTPAEGAIQRR